MSRSDDPSSGRPLSPSELALVRWILHHEDSAERRASVIDLRAVRVVRYDESECLRFVAPTASDAVGSNSGVHVFPDADGVEVTAFLVFDPDGAIRELDLWKGDDSPIVALAASVTMGSDVEI